MERRRKQRTGWLGAALEALEGRELLSTASARLLAFRPAQIRAAVVAPRQNRPLPRNVFVPGGPVGTAYGPQAVSGAVNQRVQRLNAPKIIRPIPGNATNVPATPVTPSTPLAPTTSNVTMNQATPRWMNPRLLAGNNPLSGRLGNNPAQTAAAMIRTITGTGFVPLGPGLGALGVPTSTSTPGALATTGGAAVATSLPVDPGSMDKAMPAPDLFQGATLNAGDVAAMKGAVETFAANYTDGSDATKDADAVKALKSSLADISLGVWSRSNVTTTDAAKQFATASNDFAKNYTGGTDPAADKAAWSAFQTALNDLGASMSGPGIDKTLNDFVPPANWVMPPSWNPISGMVDPLVMDGGTLSKDDVGSLVSAVDAFATNYTSGADATKDQDAGMALARSIGDLAMKRWMIAPMPLYPPSVALA